MSSKRRKNQSRKAFLWSWCTSFTNQRIEKARNRKLIEKIQSLQKAAFYSCSLYIWSTFRSSFTWNWRCTRRTKRQETLVCNEIFWTRSEGKRGLRDSSFSAKEIEQLIQLTEKLLDDDSETILVNERYEFITQLCTLCVVSNDSFNYRWVTKSIRLQRIVG